MRSLRNRLFSAAAFLLGLTLLLTGRAASFSEDRRKAEEFYARGSFAQALAVLQQMRTNGLSDADLRGWQFRLGDTRWRAADAASLLRAEESVPELIRLASPEVPVADRDELWARANQSLAEFHRRRHEAGDWIATRYGAALDWWAGQTNLSLARQQYLDLVRSWAGSPEAPDVWYRDADGMPDQILDHAVSLAQRAEDIVLFRLVRALRFGQRGGSRSLGQVEGDFEAARKASAGTPWRDAVLFHEAQWRERAGRLEVLPEGRWERRPDPSGALVLYRRLLEEFRPGTSRYRDQATSQIDALTRVSLGVALPGTFLPGSGIEFNLVARNTTEAVLSLRPVVLTRDLRLEGGNRTNRVWMDGLPSPSGPPLRSWTERFEPPRPHEEVNKTVRLPDRLEPGAYLLEARTGDILVRELLLVTDAVLVLQSSGGRTLAWLVDAITGRPLPEAPVTLAWRELTPDQRTSRWRQISRTTDGQGLAVFEVRAGEIVGVAGPPERQAIATVYAPEMVEPGDGWKIFAFTDRPAYRPGSVVDWKILARRLNQGLYRTPADQKLWFVLRDPQGAAVTNGVVTLNAYGSAWGQFAVPLNGALGLYQITFSADSAGKTHVGDASLFRLEEYRRPEFEVTVTAPEEKGSDGILRRGVVRPGDRLTARIKATYYFGSPVAGGSVEVAVRRKPFQWFWPVAHEFPWLHEPDDSFHRRRFGGGEEIRRETLLLDAMGQVDFGMETDPDGGDAEYEVSARVTDSSRRVVSASADFKVARDGYSVQARPVHNLPRPRDVVRVEYQAKDANGHPVAATGKVTITREFWWEIWFDSFGREVEGDDLKRRQAASPVWPPRPEPGQKEWRLKFRGFRADDLGARTVALGTNGIGELTFTPERVGYYRFAWSSPDLWSIPGARVAITNQIRAEAAVWVGTTQTADLGYRTGGVQIVVDQDTFRTGQKAPVMIVGPRPDRWVLFTIQGGGIPVAQVLHLADGATRFLEMDVTESLEPNAVLQAVLVEDRRVLTDRREIVVPPVRHFLSVNVETDAREQTPGAEGHLRITTRDADGHPVAAQVAVAVVDDSLLAIQQDLAGDPRSFFFGSRRGVEISLNSSLVGGYVRLVKGSGDVWYDDRYPPAEPAEMEEARGGRGADPSLANRYGLRPLADTLSVGQFQEDGVMLGMRPKNITPLPLGRVLGRAMSTMAGVAVSEPAVVVRHDFRETAFWQPDVITSADGTARVAFRYPDSATRWGVRAIAATKGSQFGEGATNTVTKLPLGVRLQTPRFLVAGDEATISVSLDNTTADPLRVTPTLEVEGITMLGRIREGKPETGSPAAVEVPAGGSAQVDWIVRAITNGPASLTATARGPGVSDAMRRDLVVVEKGIEQMLSRSGKAASGEVTVHLDLPPRKAGSTRFAVRLTPSLAVTMLDALPYLADYPYGCTEQTLSRFLPAVIVRRTLAEVGLDADAAMNRAFGGIGTNAAGRASPALGTRKDLGKLDDMIAAGLKRLYDGQNGAAWGWWPGGGEDVWMTAYVVWGLRLAQQSGVTVEEPRLIQAERWLTEHLVQLADRPDEAAWALHALAARRTTPGQPAVDPLELRALERVYGQRAELSSGARALVLLAAPRFGKADWAKILAENLSNGVVRDLQPDASVIYQGAVQGGSTVPTAHWGGGSQFGRWGDGAVEATAFSVRALLAMDPANALVEPAVAWLLQNRRGASWNNTRDTALTLLCLTDFLRVSGELKRSLDAEIWVNGRSLVRTNWSPAGLLAAPSEFAVPEDWLRDTNEVRIVRHGGEAPIYFGVEARFFTADAPRAAGSDLFVRRDYFKLVPVETLLKGVQEKRVRLEEGDGVASGDLVECRLVFEAKNDTEYLLFEDRKPAGFEATEVQSGWGPSASRITPAEAQGPGVRRAEPGRSEPLFFEWRDRRAAIFASRLTAGFWEIRYRYRAETPGRFAALPVTAEAMYVPGLRANSVGQEVRITEAAR